MTASGQAARTRRARRSDQARPAARAAARRLAPAVASALQAALAAEQAAAYGYGVAGSHLSGTQADAASADWIAHQAAADRLDGLLTAGGATAPPAGVAYRLPGPVHTAAQATALAATLEDQVTSAYLGLVAHGGPDLRVLGAQQARAAALRAARWRGRTEAFPGLSAAGR
jgi:hypothetical protein